jgi:hypothetical protein
MPLWYSNDLLGLKPRSFLTHSIGGEYRPRYLSPSSGNVAGGIVVRIANIATACTGKFEDVAMTTRPTDMAGFRGIGRGYQYDCGSSILGLIGDELPKLGEGPRVMPISLHFADTGPLSDTGQIFQSNVLLADTCGLDDTSTDAVVDRVHMPLSLSHINRKELR